MILNNRLLIISCMSCFLITSSIIPAFAAPGFDIGQQLQGDKCKIKGSKVVISVTEKVLNDNDSGTGGIAWAIDNFTRIIRVVQQQDGSFCAMLFYQGQFNTIGDKGPFNATSFSSDMEGTFAGVVKTKLFTATLSPTVPTSGFIGTFDYKCNANSSCPGYVKWQNLFFTNISGLDSSWFRFVYNGNMHGTWINSSTGDSGDITR